jgi:predicted DCC family thiol-disulfide oxidoreductase YuxK
MAPTLEDKQTRPVLFFDGNCPICRKNMPAMRIPSLRRASIIE